MKLEKENLDACLWPVRHEASNPILDSSQYLYDHPELETGNYNLCAKRRLSRMCWISIDQKYCQSLDSIASSNGYSFLAAFDFRE